ncbi:MAG TPA: hypothetical protein VM802_28305 [Chitinophaga sp.]|uniref:hypothetical protein n=1 Tax=Chitinophaga sp. TaxID=1869181 RepID=UPI002C781973|nr:hypothetical protein [Chitinophaga sp.]HVI48805.1 hypothetical protein [Chitinophaga sp.]
MTTISHENLIASGFSYVDFNQSYKIRIGQQSYGVVQNADKWLFSPLPMQHASLISIASMEEISALLYPVSS